MSNRIIYNSNNRLYYGDNNFNVQKGLVGHWPLNSTDGATDLIGGNDGTLNGGMGYSSGGGRRYAVFDGVDDYLTVGSGFSGLVGAERFTYACWLYQNNTSDAIIFDRNQNAGAGRRLLYIYRYLNFIHVLLGDSDDTYFGDSVFPATTWIHMAVAWDKDLNSGLPRCYFNGTEVGAYTVQDARTTALPSTNDTMYVGMHSNGSVFPFPGRMSDLRIYNRALLASEIARLAQIIY